MPAHSYKLHGMRHKNARARHDRGRRHIRRRNRSQRADECRRNSGKFRSGIRIRRGEHCSKHAETDGSGQKRLLIYRNGTWKVETLTNENCKSYISQGVYNSLRYQWQVIANGKATNEHDTYYHNRTVFAQISENKYIMAVGEFMPLDNMMKVLIAYGARNAFLLNGGNCSSMYVKGIGNTTGSKATQLKNLNKPCVIESEFFAANGMLGLNSAGKQKLGGPCNELDIVYIK